MNPNTRKFCLLALVAFAVFGNLTKVAAQEVAYGANETSKSLALSRAQLVPTLAVVAKSEPMARVCEVPDGAAAARSFVASISSQPPAGQQQRARLLLRGLKGFEMTDNGENRTTTSIDAGLWDTLGFPGSPRWWNQNSPRNLGVSSSNLAALNNGQSASIPVHSRCLTVPNFKAWVSELVRILEQYYQITN